MDGYISHFNRQNMAWCAIVWGVSTTIRPYSLIKLIFLEEAKLTSDVSRHGDAQDNEKYTRLAEVGRSQIRVAYMQASGCHMYLDVLTAGCQKSSYILKNTPKNAMYYNPMRLLVTRVTGEWQWSK